MEKHFGEWADYSKFREFMNSKYMNSVFRYLNQEYKKGHVYPPKQDVFKAFRLCQPRDFKVLIVGQDPYHNGKATGLAFGNPENTLRMSPSLQEIRKVLEKEDGLRLHFDVTLESWAKQGVLLLNTALTVQEGIPASHETVWDKFTKFVISFLVSTNKECGIVCLWGEHAKKYQVIGGIDIEEYVDVLTCEHPMAAVYDKRDWDCDHFLKINHLIYHRYGADYCIKW